MPSWHADRCKLSWSVIVCTTRAAPLPSRAMASMRVGRTLTRANSAATKNPLVRIKTAVPMILPVESVTAVSTSGMGC